MIVSCIATMILNNLAFQLESLHLDDKVHGWEFMSNNYTHPCTKDTMNNSWFPRNVKQLCLQKTKFSSPTAVWSVINCTMLPKLKHLQIQWDFESGDNFEQIPIKNLTSFVQMVWNHYVSTVNAVT